MANRIKLLYIDCYALPEGAAGDCRRAPSSMSIGYGVTASRVIRQSLQRQGFDLVRPLADVKPFTDGTRRARLSWVLRGYQQILESLITERPALVFVFHSFSAFPTEIRRILLELGQDVPIVGYTHGSHWDPSDLVRMESYPGLELLDLANLAVLDAILFDSACIKDAVISNIGQHNARLAESLESRARVVGLPLDLDLIDSRRQNQTVSGIQTVVFNHAPVAAKDPVAFMRIIDRLMPSRDFNVLFTRAFSDDDPGALELKSLRDKFGDRIAVGEDLCVSAYYDALWSSSIQVSTALHESLGISTLEAMYTENCCLVPDRGSYPEITSENRDALYGTVGDLENRLMFALDNPQYAQRVGITLAERARDYGAKLVMPRIVSAIEDAMRVRIDRDGLPEAGQGLG